MGKFEKTDKKEIKRVISGIMASIGKETSGFVADEKSFSFLKELRPSAFVSLLYETDDAFGVLPTMEDVVRMETVDDLVECVSAGLDSAC